MSNNVEHPNHYNQGGIECIDAIAEAIKNLKGIDAFEIGNVIKYCWRFDNKNGLEDLQKASWYLNDNISRRQNNAR